MSSQFTTVESLREGGLYVLPRTQFGQRFYVVFLTDTIGEESLTGYLYTLADYHNGGEVSWYVNSDGTIDSASSGLPIRAVAVVADLIDTGARVDDSDGSLPLTERVLHRLDLTTDELSSLYAASPVNGFVGTDIAARLAERFGLDVSLPLGEQLAELGVLTDAEAEWFDDAE